jgi:hypothetical protein
MRRDHLGNTSGRRGTIPVKIAVKEKVRVWLRSDD